MDPGNIPTCHLSLAIAIAVCLFVFHCLFVCLFIICLFGNRLFVCRCFAKMQFGRSYTSNTLDLGNIPTYYLSFVTVVAVCLFVYLLVCLSLFCLTCHDLVELLLVAQSLVVPLLSHRDLETVLLQSEKVLEKTKDLVVLHPSPLFPSISQGPPQQTGKPDQNLSCTQIKRMRMGIK